jgi:hypothetical protein
LQLIPDVAAATPDWLPADPVAQIPENRPPPPAPVLLEQPTVVLGPEADPKPEPRKPLVLGAPSAVVMPASPPPVRQPPPPVRQPLPPAPTASWDPEKTDDDADLPMVVPDEVLPPVSARGGSLPPTRRPSSPPEAKRPSIPPVEARRISAPPPEPIRAPPSAVPRSRTELFGDPMRPVSVIPGEHRVVVHTLAGPLKRGTLRDPDLDAPQFDLVVPNGSVEKIAVGLIKAIFFMMAPGQAPPQPEGKRLTVSFADGRQLSGFCPEVRDSDPGFFILPADSRTNTARIYILRAAVKDIVEG